MKNQINFLLCALFLITAANAYSQSTNANFQERIEDAYTRMQNNISKEYENYRNEIGKILEEANELSSDIRADKNNYYYWLGSAQGCAKMWTISNSGTFYGDNYYSDIRAIRPVIIVPTSAL